MGSPREEKSIFMESVASTHSTNIFYSNKILKFQALLL